MTEKTSRRHGMPQPTHAVAAAPSGEIAELRRELASVRRQLKQAQQHREAAAAHEKLLQREVQHRVRNMLAVIRSVFARTVESDYDVSELDGHFRGRLDALARHQVSIGVDPRGASDLEAMIRAELQSFEFGDRIDIAGPDVALAYNVAQSLGLAIHELATNAIKFGALSTADAPTRLDIRWTVSNSRLVLDWTEKGVAVLAPAPVRTGFGRQFIEQALPYQLGADTAFDLRPGGLCCRIAIDLKTAAAVSPTARSWL